MHTHKKNTRNSCNLRVVVDHAAAHVLVHDEVLLCDVVARVGARRILVNVAEVYQEARCVLELLHRGVCAQVHVLVDVADNKVARVLREHNAVGARVEAVQLAVQDMLAKAVDRVDEVGLHALALHVHALVWHSGKTRVVLALDGCEPVDVLAEPLECRVRHVALHEQIVRVARGHAEGGV
jgi:hypothetical protein